MAQLDETTEYGKLLAILSVFGPQLDTTPSVLPVAPGRSPVSVPRLTLANRLRFIFDAGGRLSHYVGLKGESVNLLVDPSHLSGQSDFMMMVDALSAFGKEDVLVSPQEPGGPRITLSGRGTFTFTPDGCLCAYVDGDGETFVDVWARPKLPQSQPPSQPQRTPIPQRPAQQQRAIPGQAAAEAHQEPSQAPGTPWPQRKGQGS